MTTVPVHIGPVASRSVLVWAEAAQSTIVAARARADLEVPAEVVDRFQEYVDAWVATAQRGAVFVWDGEIDDAELRLLAAHWARLVTIERTDATSGLEPAAPEGEAFYNALAMGILEASAAAEDAQGFSGKFEEAVPDFDLTPETAGRTAEGPVRRVLLVDDSEDIRLLMRIAIDRDPRLEMCAEAADGQAAIDACRASCPDAVLLDLLMPVMSGYDALPLLREACPDTTIVVFSAVLSPQNHERVLALGATAAFQKMEDTSVVLDALAGA